jgi:hypothetical protein
MVSATVRDAASSVATTFLLHGRQSPFHLANQTGGGPTWQPNVKALFRAFDSADDPPNRQKAATPQLLKDLAASKESLGEVARHTADLTIGAYFFAMRACEFCKTKRKGKTKLLTLSCLAFRDRKKRPVSQDDPYLLTKAEYVTVCFVNQKNGMKNEKRTQRKTGKKWLCPVRAWGRACQRARSGATGKKGDVPVCQIQDRSNTILVSDEKVVQGLRATCRVFGGKRNYGFDAKEIGSRSIRSGAAMALFIKNHSIERIKILGRWLSDAFMAYIRPQVMEWTSIMARDMASAKDFLDLGYKPGTNRRTDRNDRDDMGLLF